VDRLEKVKDKACKKKDKMNRKYCKTVADYENCAKWRDAEKLKCSTQGECKVDLLANKM